MDKEPEKPYIYQPYGTENNKNIFREDGIYGIGGVRGAEIKGLNGYEARKILSIFLKEDI